MKIMVSSFSVLRSAHNAKSSTLSLFIYFYQMNEKGRADSITVCIETSKMEGYSVTSVSRPAAAAHSLPAPRVASPLQLNCSSSDNSSAGLMPHARVVVAVPESISCYFLTARMALVWLFDATMASCCQIISLGRESWQIVNATLLVLHSGRMAKTCDTVTNQPSNSGSCL